MKILIIRFSSFGDVLQTLSVVGRLRESFPQSEIHWVTRQEFCPLLDQHPGLSQVFFLPQGAGFLRLLQLGRALRREHYTHIYDAHNNLRSQVLSGQLLFFRRAQIQFLRRSIYRWRRFLLFEFRKNLFPQPFSGQRALLEPIVRWGVPIVAPKVPQLFLPSTLLAETERRIPFQRFVCLAPSAAFELKRWPKEYWKDLIRLCPKVNFVLLGGPKDDFLHDIVAAAPERVINMAGHLSLVESAAVVQLSQALVSNDTGLMHVAEQVGRSCLALMGPAPFGFPSRPATQIFQVNLPCRPCSKHGQGPCVNIEFQKCLRDILPETVARSLRSLLNAPLDASIS